MPAATAAAAANTAGETLSMHQTDITHPQCHQRIPSNRFPPSHGHGMQMTVFWLNSAPEFGSWDMATVSDYILNGVKRKERGRSNVVNALIPLNAYTHNHTQSSQPARCQASHTNLTFVEPACIDTCRIQPVS